MSSLRKNDLVAGPNAAWLWYLPAIVVLIGLAWHQGRSWLWLPAFSVMGVACLANAARCGRLHCYVTGPVFLLTALYLLFTVFQIVPLYAGPTILIVVGITALSFLVERSLGTYRGNNKDPCKTC